MSHYDKIREEAVNQAKQTMDKYKDYMTSADALDKTEWCTPDELKNRLGPWDTVEKPEHYNSHPSGIQCIEITQHMNFCLGNAFKYLWRSGLKSDDAVEDLKKAIWYINKEIERVSSKLN